MKHINPAITPTSFFRSKSCGCIFEMKKGELHSFPIELCLLHKKSRRCTKSHLGLAYEPFSNKSLYRKIWFIPKVHHPTS